jgi:hypothetical protein
MKLRTIKRTNADTTSSTIVTPVKQRRVVVDTMKNANISSNSLITANTSTGFKTSMMVIFVFV